MEQDRRRNPRYPFAGSIEMREGTSKTSGPPVSKNSA